MENSGKIYRYYYDTGEFTSEPYKFLGTPFKYGEDMYVVAADSINDIYTQRYIYNWTQQKKMDIDLNDYFPDLLQIYVPNECVPFISFYKKGFIGKRIKKGSDATTTLYKLESLSFSSLKISESIKELNTDCYTSLEYGDYLYLVSGNYYEDLLKYNPETNEVVDSYRKHYPDEKKYNTIHWMGSILSSGALSLLCQSGRTKKSCCFED